MKLLLLTLTLTTLTLTHAYDDGMWHPSSSPTAAAISSPTTSAAAVVSTPPVPLLLETSKYADSWSPTLSKTTYAAYWSANQTTTHSMASPSSANGTMSARPGNMTASAVDRVYTTTICDFQRSCYTTVATATGAGSQVRTGAGVGAGAQPTMTPFSASGRLVASGWAAVVLCGVAWML